MTAPILDRLAEHEATIRRFTGEIVRVKQAHEATRRELAAAEQRLASFHQDNPDADTAELDRLIGELQRIRSRVDVNAPRGWIDIAARSKADALRRQQAAARIEMEELVRRHRDAIIAAKLEESYTRQREQEAAIADLEAKGRAWTATLQSWGPLLRPLGLSGHDLPHTNPIADGVSMLRMRLAQRPDVPAPQSLIEQPTAITIDARTGQPVGASAE